MFYEYFHGDNGAELGASHQTGWSGLVARSLDLFARMTAEDGLRAPTKVMAHMTREQVTGSRKAGWELWAPLVGMSGLQEAIH